MATIELKPGFGYVIASYVAYTFAGLKISGDVMEARKKYNVNYPTMYADPKTNPNADKFNCFQRAHQNHLENAGTFTTLLFVAGLRNPVTAAACGVIYAAGRLAYAKGYQTGNPSGRYWGSFQYIGLLTLLGISCRLAYETI